MKRNKIIKALIVVGILLVIIVALHILGGNVVEMLKKHMGM